MKRLGVLFGLLGTLAFLALVVPGARSLWSELRAPAAALPRIVPPSSAPGSLPASPPEVPPELGPYRVPEERLVSYTLRSSTALTFREGAVVMPLESDALGLRRRRTQVPPDALRVVVLGDSVAFGFGLDEGGTLAEQLERELASLAPSRPVACFTVALPSWNVDNAFRFLLDHLDHFRPDLVLWMPVSNDLEDGYGVTESGDRRAGDDPSSDVPGLHVRPEWGFLAARARELGPAAERARARAGPEVLVSGATPLSRRRFARVAAVVGAARLRLERAGARLVLAGYEQSDFQRELRAELIEAGLALEELALFEGLTREDSLGIDPHPSARTVGVMARFLAEELVARGWIPGARPPGPAWLAPELRARQARLPARDEALSWSRAHRLQVAETLEAHLVPATLQGMLQVYGGIHLDDSLEPVFGAALPEGRELVLRLAPLADVPDLYPLEVEVRAQERTLGVLRLEAGGECVGRFALEPGGGPFDVVLRASDHVRVTRRGQSALAWGRLIELESVP